MFSSQTSLRLFCNGKLAEGQVEAERGSAERCCAANCARCSFTQMHAALLDRLHCVMPFCR